MRYIFKGNITFGLVNIPVGVVPATKDTEISFTLLHKKDLSPVRYARVCVEEEKEIPYSQIVRGVKKSGSYVLIEKEDIEKAQVDKSRHIEIITICNKSEVDSIYYLKPYYLVPQKDGEKGYQLLQKALFATDQVAIARFSMRDKTHIGAITVYNGMLILNQLRFQSQILKPSSKGTVKISKNELDLAEKLLQELKDHFHPEKLHNTYVETLQKTILRKKVGKKISQKKEPLAEVYDLQELLKKSIKTKKVAPKKKVVSLKSSPLEVGLREVFTHCEREHLPSIPPYKREGILLVRT